MVDQIQRTEARMTFCENNEVEWERNLGSKVEIISNVGKDLFLGRQPLHFLQYAKIRGNIGKKKNHWHFKFKFFKK